MTQSKEIKKGVIVIKAKFDTKFLATGILDKAERKEFKSGNGEMLKITIKSGEDYFTFDFFNTKKDPQRVRGMMTKLRKGDFIKTEGSISINEYEDKEGNLRKSQNYSAFYIQHIEEISNPTIFISVAGILKKKVDKEDMGGKEITVRVFDDYRKTNDEYTFGIGNNLESFYDTADEGDNISVTAVYTNRAVADISSEHIQSFGEELDGMTPAGVKRKFERKLDTRQAKILAEESELDEDGEAFFEIDNDDIPF